MAGDNYWLVAGPVIFLVAIAIWLGLTILLGRRRQHHAEHEGRDHVGGGDPMRGPVTGGVMEGSPGQRNPYGEPRGE